MKANKRAPVMLVSLNGDEAKRIRRAATVTGEPLAAFFRVAGLERADRIAAGAQFTTTLNEVRRSLEPADAQ